MKLQGNGQVAKDLMSNLKSRFKSCLDHASVKSAVSALDLFEQFGGDSEAKPEDLEKIVAADPTRLEEKFSLASAYLARGKQQEAINLLLDIIKVTIF
jgi:thioredoxin-like negative regulator of GroEL